MELGYRGQIDNPTYEQVCGGRTGQAEVVQITFDPSAATFKELVQVFFRHTRGDDAESTGK